MSLPELIEIVPLDKPVRAEITVPGSKSITNRALVLAALSDGEVTLQGALWSEDTQIMVECLQELGFMVNVENDPDEFCNRTITVYGKGGKIPNGGTVENPLELFVGNAGTAARFLSAMVCLGSGVYRLHGVPRMHERPQAALFKTLRELGYQVEAEQGNDKLPVRIWGKAEIGKAESGKDQSLLTSSPTRKCVVSIEESSQFASALLLCAKVGGWQIQVAGENAEESPYVAMTMKLIEAFPKRGGTFPIEPDASSGGYFWAVDWLFQSDPKTNQREIKVLHWPTSGWQVDANFALTVFELKDKLKDRLSRMGDFGDSVMAAIVIAPFAREVFTGHNATEFLHLSRLRVQECDRVMALFTELSKCLSGVIEVLDDGDTLRVYHGKGGQLHGAEIETYNDHRMAMCFAILGLKVPGIKIKNPACVMKTFPNFFQKLATPPPHGLGAEIRDAKTGRKLAVEELFAD